MSLNPNAPLREYIAPEAVLYYLRMERELLTLSDQNESVGGKDDPDNDW